MRAYSINIFVNTSITSTEKRKKKRSNSPVDDEGQSSDYYYLRHAQRSTQKLAPAKLANCIGHHFEGYVQELKMLLSRNTF
jgi:hypothetical protein